eukprot:3591370-Pyramimonas_sp.AAC.1
MRAVRSQPRAPPTGPRSSARAQSSEEPESEILEGAAARPPRGGDLPKSSRASPKRRGSSCSSAPSGLLLTALPPGGMPSPRGARARLPRGGASRRRSSNS